MLQEVDMSLIEFFYIAFWCIMLTLISSFSTASLGGAIPFPYGAPFGSAYTPPYSTISPQGCTNNTLYLSVPSKNITGPLSDHQLGDWNMFIHFGACPTNNLPTTCDPVIGKTPYCGLFYSGCLSTYQHRHQEVNVIPNSKTWRQTYANAPYTWQDLDDANALVGYKSNFVRGAALWESTTDLIIAATCFMWIGLLLFFLGPFNKSRPYIFRLTPQLLYATGCLFWSIVLGLQASTSQVDAAAWSSSFFQTCDVRIKRGPTFWYGVAVVAFSGAFIVSEALFLYFMGYYPGCLDEDESTIQLHPANVSLMGSRGGEAGVVL